jgi:D-hydroxyproline dehydrogenase subunit gamma
MSAVGADVVTIHVNGHAVRCAAGCSVAAALLNAGYSTFRISVGGAARAPLCGMGSCHECRVTVDGRDHVRACLVPVTHGMRIHTGSVTDDATDPPGQAAP